MGRVDRWVRRERLAKAQPHRPEPVGNGGSREMAAGARRAPVKLPRATELGLPSAPDRDASPRETGGSRPFWPALRASHGQPTANFVWKHPKSANPSTPSPLQSAYGLFVANFVWKHPKSASPSTPSPLQSA
jgi:hypothetical protein